MAGTYSQIYIQIVFAVQGRQNLLQKEWRQEAFKYMAGIIKNKGQKPIIVNGVEDHAHVFVELKPAMAISDLVRDIKNNSSNFINDHAWIKGRFNWQEGYGTVFARSGTFADRGCVQLHFESRTTSRQADLQRRIHEFPQEV